MMIATERQFMFEMMAGSRKQERMLEFFGLLALRRTPEKKDSKSRPEMAASQPQHGKVVSQKSLKLRKFF
jgi:hypothetical protein